MQAHSVLPDGAITLAPLASARERRKAERESEMHSGAFTRRRTGRKFICAVLSPARLHLRTSRSPSNDTAYIACSSTRIPPSLPLPVHCTLQLFFSAGPCPPLPFSPGHSFSPLPRVTDDREHAFTCAPGEASCSENKMRIRQEIVLDVFNFPSNLLRNA